MKSQRRIRSKQFSQDSKRVKMQRISAVAGITFKELFRKRILFLALLFGLLLVGSALFLSPLAVGARQKIVLDVGLASISIIGVMATVLLGGALLHEEIDRKAIYVVLSRPISRSSFVAGKLIGLVSAVSLVFVVMTAVLVVTAYASRAHLGPAIFASIYLSFLETSVIASLVIFFSTFTTPMLTAFFALSFFAAGSLSNDLLAFARAFGGTGIKIAAWFFYYLLPNLRVFNLRHEAVHNLPFEFSDLVLATCYAGVYVAVALYFACLLFRRREFA